MLNSPDAVARRLVTYLDWWQPMTGSILQVGTARRAKGLSDGLRPGLLETLDERAELCRRVWRLGERDRVLLFLWYVQQLDVEDITQALGISRRHFFRLRAQAIRAIVKMGEPEEAA